MKRGLNVRQTCGALSFYQRKMVYMLYEYRICNYTNYLIISDESKAFYVFQRQVRSTNNK